MAEQLGSKSSPAAASTTSGYNSLTVRSLAALRQFCELSGCPSMYWPLAALLPMSSQ